MNFPEDLKYSKEHEWIRMSENIATVGITDFAQDQLGEVVFVELPNEGEFLKKDDSLGTVESVKAVSDVFMPVSGRVIEVNDPLSDNPETVNEDPYGEGWLVKVEVANPEDLKSLMSAEHYQAFVNEEA